MSYLMTNQTLKRTVVKIMCDDKNFERKTGRGRGRRRGDKGRIRGGQEDGRGKRGVETGRGWRGGEG